MVMDVSMKEKAAVDEAVDIAGVPPEKVVLGNRKPFRNLNDSRYVLYWMVGSYRSRQNEALEVAKALANSVDLPVLVVATVDLDFYRQGSLRHVVFLLEGLSEVEKNLRLKRVHLVVRMDPPSSLVKGATAVSVIGSEKVGVTGFEKFAYAIVCDRQFLRKPRTTMETVCKEADCMTIVVESRLAIPLQIATPNHHEVSDTKHFLDTYFERAGKFCPDIANQHISRRQILCDLKELGYSWDPMNADWKADDWLVNEAELHRVLDLAGVDITVTPTREDLYRGGEMSARRLLTIFLSSRLKSYNENLQALQDVERPKYGSMLGPYLTFGFITTSDVILKLHKDADHSDPNVQALARNLGKRELAYHKCYYNPAYDSYDALVPHQVRNNLMVQGRFRALNHRYSSQQWERAETHDEQWNAAQMELITSGKGMRANRQMWCQKIVMGERDPEKAFTIAILLNDKYMLDALDPCSLTGVAEAFSFVRAPEIRLDRSFGKGFMALPYWTMDQLRLLEAPVDQSEKDKEARMSSSPMLPNEAVWLSLL